MAKKKPLHLHKKNGRPTKMTFEVLSKLEGGFMNGFSDEDSCIFAEITPDTLYKYCKKNPAFYRKKEALKKKPLLQSVIVINNAINGGDINTAKWYAERKGKNDFSLRTEVDINDEPERKFSSIKIINGKKIVELK